jgi:hypothetical protein
VAYPNLVIPELHLVGVADPGSANSERVVLRPTQSIRLHGYGLTVGIPAERGGGALPLFDNCFWFPDIQVAPPSWVLVFTGKGNVQESIWQSGERVLALHWQRWFTIFGNRNLVPVLFRVDGSAVGPLL